MTDRTRQNETELSGSTAGQRAGLRDLISMLNSRSTSELAGLSTPELARLEALCEIWGRRAYLERMRRSTEPQPGPSS